ncbi:MAG: hypothetical protein AAGI15_03415 [Pseudomonadota bacterium]
MTSFPRGSALLRVVVASLLVAGCNDSARGDGTAEVAASTSTGAATAAYRQRVRFKLPKALTEVSGLAITPAGELLAVDDERALVHVIDLEAQATRPYLAFGEPARPGDYEGLTILEQAIVLTDSDGRLFWGDGNQVLDWASGLGKRFEIEGLARDPLSGLLYLASKQVRRGEGGVERLHAIDLRARALRPEADLVLDFAAARAALGRDVLHPSALAFTDDGRSLWLLAARERALLGFARSGALLEAVNLEDLGRHRQAEGLALLPDGGIAIADEGGSKRARLTVYDRG